MDMTRHSVASLLATLIVAALPGPAVAVAADQPRYLTVASTTSTENSGLFRHILPQFTAQSGIEVRVVALGTGQALDVGRVAMRTSCSCTTRPRSLRSSASATASTGVR